MKKPHLIRWSAIWLISMGLVVHFAFLQVALASPPNQVPDFKLAGLHPQDTVDMAKLRGQVVLIDFWASWCGPCKRTLPALHAMKAEFPQPVFLAISVDEDLAKAKRFLATGNPDGLITLHDPQGKVAELMNIAGMPTLILVDKKGSIRYRHDGYTERDMAKIKVELQVLEREK